MADKLTGEQVVQLIKSYQTKECLWNRHDKHYRDFSERNKCYGELCDEFNLPEHEVKKKIVNLRTWFARVLRRIETSKKQSLDSGVIAYEPSSPIFDALLFLSDVLRRQTKERRRIVKPDVSTLNIKSDVNIEEPEESLQEVEEYIFHEKDSDLDDDSNLYDPMEETYYLSPIKNKSSEQRSTKRMKLESSTSGKVFASTYMEDAGTTSADNSVYNYNGKERDEIDYFCKSLASQMRKLTARSMIELQMEIQNAVSKKRLEDWDKSYKHF